MDLIKKYLPDFPEDFDKGIDFEYLKTLNDSDYKKLRNYYDKNIKLVNLLRKLEGINLNKLTKLDELKNLVVSEFSDSSKYPDLSKVFQVVQDEWKCTLDIVDKTYIDSDELYKDWLIHNQMVECSAAGSGKTTAVAKILKYELYDKAGNVVYATCRREMLQRMYEQLIELGVSKTQIVRFYNYDQCYESDLWRVGLNNFKPEDQEMYRRMHDFFYDRKKKDTIPQIVLLTTAWLPRTIPEDFNAKSVVIDELTIENAFTPISMPVRVVKTINSSLKQLNVSSYSDLYLNHPDLQFTFMQMIADARDTILQNPMTVDNLDDKLASTYTNLFYEQLLRGIIDEAFSLQALSNKSKSRDIPTEIRNSGRNANNVDVYVNLVQPWYAAKKRGINNYKLLILDATAQGMTSYYKKYKFYIKESISWNDTFKLLSYTNTKLPDELSFSKKSRELSRATLLSVCREYIKDIFNKTEGDIYICANNDFVISLGNALMDFDANIKVSNVCVDLGRDVVDAKDVGAKRTIYIGHYASERGSNNYKSCTTCIILGDYIMNLGVTSVIARALSDVCKDLTFRIRSSEFLQQITRTAVRKGKKVKIYHLSSMNGYSDLFLSPVEYLESKNKVEIIPYTRKPLITDGLLVNIPYEVLPNKFVKKGRSRFTVKLNNCCITNDDINLALDTQLIFQGFSPKALCDDYRDMIAKEVLKNLTN